jgi:5-methyltetrahydrofolate--homocysteine methyltransferase
MPKSAEDRIAEAKALLEKCQEAGLDSERLYIDVICMSVASSQGQGSAVLEAVRRIKRELGVKTFAAVSNVSFGLPNRRLLNRTYLAMLLEAGLDGAILDPTDEGIQNTMYAACALAGQDSYCTGYIKHHKRRKA